jgi:hypothetical protein
MAVSAFAALGQMFYEPAKAFQSLKENPRGWLPVVLVTLLTALTLFWYYSTVDSAFLIEHTLAAVPDAKPEAREAMQKMLNPSTTRAMAVGGSLIGLPVFYALCALYFLLASKFTSSNISYGKWFSFVGWTNVPNLLLLPLMALQIVTGGGRVAPEDLNMTSFNYLLFHLQPDNRWFALMSNLSLITIWTTVLTVIGLRAWTGRSVASCVTIALLPLIVIYGIWAAKIAFLG